MECIADALLGKVVEGSSPVSLQALGQAAIVCLLGIAVMVVTDMSKKMSLMGAQISRLEEKTIVLSELVTERSAALSELVNERSCLMSHQFDERTAALTDLVFGRTFSLSQRLDQKTTLVSQQLDEQVRTLTDFMASRTTTLMGLLGDQTASLTDLVTAQVKALNDLVDARANTLTEMLRNQSASLTEQIDERVDAVERELSLMKDELASLAGLPCKVVNMYTPPSSPTHEDLIQSLQTRTHARSPDQTSDADMWSSNWSRIGSVSDVFQSSETSEGREQDQLRHLCLAARVLVYNRICSAQNFT